MRWMCVILVAAAIGIGGCSRSEEPQAKSPSGVDGGALAGHAGKGIGPVQQVELGPIDDAMAEKGKAAFEQKCAACHRFDERFVGPPLKGVTERRKPEWIMNMILNPVEMTQKDPQAKELLGTYLTQMTFQNVSQEEARAILEYFRKLDGAS